MTYGDELEITRNILNAEQLAENLLQAFWKATGHKGNIKDLKVFDTAKKRVMRSININKISDAASCTISNLDYGKFHTGEYRLI